MELKINTSDADYMKEILKEYKKYNLVKYKEYKKNNQKWYFCKINDCNIKDNKKIKD